MAEAGGAETINFAETDVYDELQAQADTEQAIDHEEARSSTGVRQAG